MNMHFFWLECVYGETGLTFCKTAFVFFRTRTPFDQKVALFEMNKYAFWLSA